MVFKKKKKIETEGFCQRYHLRCRLWSTYSSIMLRNFFLSLGIENFISIFFIPIFSAKCLFAAIFLMFLFVFLSRFFAQTFCPLFCFNESTIKSNCGKGGQPQKEQQLDTNNINSLCAGWLLISLKRAGLVCDEMKNTELISIKSSRDECYWSIKFEIDRSDWAIFFFNFRLRTYFKFEKRNRCILSKALRPSVERRRS